jgi:hypothetical protein
MRNNYRTKKIISILSDIVEYVETVVIYPDNCMDETVDGKSKKIFLKPILSDPYHSIRVVCDVMEDRFEIKSINIQRNKYTH